MKKKEGIKNAYIVVSARSDHRETYLRELNQAHTAHSISISFFCFEIQYKHTHNW